MTPYPDKTQKQYFGKDLESGIMWICPESLEVKNCLACECVGMDTGCQLIKTCIEYKRHKDLEKRKTPKTGATPVASIEEKVFASGVGGHSPKTSAHPKEVKIIVDDSEKPKKFSK